MTFDARSRERLEALGRTLPKKLPPPERPKPVVGPSALAQNQGGAEEHSKKHPLEQDLDPAGLFRALMQASPDGNVPPHLLERLKVLEQPTDPTPPIPPVDSSGPAKVRRPSTASGPVSLPGGPARQAPRGASADPDLYTAFAQLLLEEDANG